MEIDSVGNKEFEGAVGLPGMARQQAIDNAVQELKKKKVRLERKKNHT